MLNRFGLYDFIAVLIPGIFFLWALTVIIENPILDKQIPISGNLTETSILIVIGFIAGILIQGISQFITEKILFLIWGGIPSARMLLPNNQTFTTKYKEELSSIIEKKFNTQLKLEAVTKTTDKEVLKRNQEIFYLCYRSLEKQSELPQIFNAQYGLFRSLFTVFVLLSIILIFQLVTSCFEKKMLLYFSISIVCSFITYFRVSKRANDFSKCVYDLFVVHNK